MMLRVALSRRRTTLAMGFLCPATSSTRGGVFARPQRGLIRLLTTTETVGPCQMEGAGESSSVGASFFVTA
jgi:hypothetical protein